ncbi:SRPBCC family protein [Salegentibacter sp. F14]
MKPNPLLEFTVDKENNLIKIRREFNASKDLVWQAWTTPELLDQWWAPKPYRTKTKSLDFKEGGQWLYAMISPEDEIHWSKADYKTIDHLQSITWLDAFCDEHGKENSGKPRSFWTNTFKEHNGNTIVQVTLEHQKAGDLEVMIKMGFKEGFTMALQNLAELLPTLKK